MPTTGFSADLESGLSLRSGPRSSAPVGCADVSWSALRCTLSVAEEAARQLHLCVAWVSEESQRDYDAWNAAKKDDDLFGPLRPASKQPKQVDAAAYAAAPRVHADFSRNHLDNGQGVQQQGGLFNSPDAPQHRTLTQDTIGGTCASATVWEDFKCSPTQLQYHAPADTTQAVAVTGTMPVVCGVQLQGHGPNDDSAHHLNLPGEI